GLRRSLRSTMRRPRRLQPPAQESSYAQDERKHAAHPAQHPDPHVAASIEDRQSPLPGAQLLDDHSGVAGTGRLNSTMGCTKRHPRPQDETIPTASQPSRPSRLSSSTSFFRFTRSKVVYSQRCVSPTTSSYVSSVAVAMPLTLAFHSRSGIGNKPPRAGANY